MLHRRHLLASSLCLTALAGPAFAASPPQCVDSAGFVRLHGPDTLSVEIRIADCDAVRGEFYSFEARARARYDADLTGHPRASRLDLQLWAAGSDLAGAPNQTARLVMVPDSALFVVNGEQGVQEQWNRAPAGAVPAFQMALGLEELVIRVARRSGRSRTEIPCFFIATDGWAPTATVTFPKPGSATLQVDALNGNFKIDSAGHILDGVYEPSSPPAAPVVVRRLPYARARALLIAHIGSRTRS